MNSHTPAFVKHLLPFFLILLLALFAFAFLREPKPIAHEGILPEQELSEAGAYLLEVDVPREIELNLPEIRGLSAALSAPEGLTAAYAEGRLTLSAAQVGEFPLEITLSARGYENLTLSLPLTVRPHEMELSLLPVSDGIPADWTPDTVLSLNAGSSVSFSLSAPEGALFSVLSDSPALEASISGNLLMLTASEDAEGSAEIHVAATLDKYADAALSFIVAVKPAPEPVPEPAAQPTPAPGPAETSDTPSPLSQRASFEVDTSAHDDTIRAIIRLTNDYRAEHGLPPLEHLPGVDAAAMLRAQESAELFDHTRPNGESFSTVLADCGLRYRIVGENLHAANRVRTPDQVLQAWIDSAGHRENLLRDSFAGIGVGVYFDGEWWYWCQLFVNV